MGTPKELKVNGGRSYILEFDAGLSNTVKLLRVDTSGLSTVQAGWFSSQPPKVRIHFKVDPGTEPVLQQISDGWKVSFGDTLAVKKDDAAAKFIEQVNSKPESKAPTTPKNPLSDVLTKAKNDKSKTDKSTTGTSPLPGVKDPNAGPQTDPDKGNPGDEQTTPSVIKKTEQTRPNPPLTKPTTVEGTKTRPQETQKKPLINEGRYKKLVSLNFDRTEITLILQTLAKQAGVNIVTAPDIKGQMSVALDNVTVEEALGYVTSMAGLRYGIFSQAFVVAPKDKFNELVRELNGSNDKAATTMLVPIYSGEAEHVKKIVAQALPPDTARGSYDIIIEGEGDDKKGKSAPSKDGGAKNEAAPADSAGGQSGGKSSSTLFVMVVGSGAVVQEVADLIKSTDEKICAAYSIPIPDSSALVQDTYVLSSEDMHAKYLIDTVKGLNGSVFHNVEMYPSPLASDRQAIVMVGRKTEIERAKKVLSEFDGASDESMNYEVKAADPRALANALKSAVPGIRVEVAPIHALQPGAYVPPTAKKSSQSVENGKESVSQETGGEKKQNVDYAKTSAADSKGIELPYSEAEKVSLPMRLIIRGSKPQIDRAREQLMNLDVEAKQVAIDLRVMELSHEDAQRVGIDWGILTGGTLIRVNQGTGDSRGTPGNISGSLDGKTSVGIPNFAGGKDPLTATLDEIANKHHLIARPNFLAVDGRETEYFIGDVIRYVESIQTTQNGTTVTTAEVRVGVRCAILARVAAGNKIMLDFQPVLSYLRGFTPVPGGGQLPQTSERIGHGASIIENGQTLVLGGLIKEEDRKNVSGIPILKDLPLFGNLFKRTDINRQKSEIVFFITARVVDKDNIRDAALPRANERNNAENPVKDSPDPFKKNDVKKPAPKG